MDHKNQPLSLSIGKKPLPESLRPDSLENFIGQPHIINPRSFLVSQISKGNLVSSIFWGPPGVGKTTLARILSSMAHYEMIELSAVKASLADVKQFLKRAESGFGQFALFLDEIHRFNKLQQDALLPAVEKGDIVLLGATTENPAFGIIPALRSRMRIFEFRPLSLDELRQGVMRGIAWFEKRDKRTIAADEVMDQLILLGGGDMRNTLILLEDLYSYCSQPEGDVVLTKEALAITANKKLSDYDGGYDAHYDHASAFQKSLRGSSVDGALYWLGKMIEGGEDPLFIARRLVVTAAEDVGMADPMALLQAQAAMDAIKQIGFPEARIPLAQAVIYVASAPKSNAVIASLGAVTSALKEGHSHPVPMHLKDAHFAGARASGRGNGYVYPHEPGSRRITYLPEQFARHRFFTPAAPAEIERMQELERFLSQHHRLAPTFSPAQTAPVLEWIENHRGDPVKTETMAADLAITREEAYQILTWLERSGTITITKWATIDFVS